MLLSFAAMTLAIPAAHAAQCPVSAHWNEGAPDEQGMIIVPAKNVVTVGPDGLSWNFKRSDLPIILRYAAIVRTMNPRPWLIVDASGSDCAELKRVTEAVEAAAECSPEHCFVAREPVKPEPTAAQIILPKN